MSCTRWAAPRLPGLTAYLGYDGYLCYEYNLFIIHAHEGPLRAAAIGTGQRRSEISTEYAELKPPAAR